MADVLSMTNINDIYGLTSTLNFKLSFIIFVAYAGTSSSEEEPREVLQRGSNLPQGYCGREHLKKLTWEAGTTMERAAEEASRVHHND
ncbi:hypothetical protein RB195_003148 [Necator americanus]|uniref:Uncharacterized protein n=1 Tax=Necator americanus TaxID=51031 RepID=A0ABR1DM82_NECAM